MELEVTEVPPASYAVIRRTVRFEELPQVMPEPIELVRTPEQRAAVYVHVGPYDELPKVYERFWDVLLAAGRTAAGEPREICESHDPEPTTRIIWPIE